MDYYEDDVLEESVLATAGLLGLLASTKGHIVKGAREMGPATKRAIKQTLLKDPNSSIDVGHIVSPKSPKQTIKNLKDAQNLKHIKSELMNKTTKKAKVGSLAAAGFGTAMGVDEVRGGFKNTKSVANSTGRGIRSTGKLLGADLPASANRTIAIIAGSISGGVGNTQRAFRAVNSAVDEGRLSKECLLNPNKCKSAITKIIKTELNPPKKRRIPFITQENFDMELNENKVELLKMGGRALTTAGKAAAAAPKKVAKWALLKDPNAAAPSIKRITGYEALKRNPVKQLKTLGTKKGLKSRATVLKQEVWDKASKKSKLALAALAANEVYDKGENVKSAYRGTKKTIKNTANLIHSGTGSAARSISLGIQLAAVSVGSVATASSIFNNNVDKGRITAECIAKPEECKFTVARAIRAAYKGTKDRVTGTASAVRNAPTSSKIAVGAAAIGGAVVASKLIKDALEKKDWYNNGCNKIDNPDKREACLAHVNAKVRKDLMSKMKRCRLANNPDRCVATIKEKISELGQ